jgi:hypothetical protein
MTTWMLIPPERPATLTSGVFPLTLGVPPINLCACLRRSYEHFRLSSKCRDRDCRPMFALHNAIKIAGPVLGETRLMSAAPLPRRKADVVRGPRRGQNWK